MANKFALRWTCSLAILLSIFMLSCDRSSLSTSNAANIKLDLPKDFNSVLTTATPEVLVHVVINVTAPDLGAPLSIIWDASGGAAPPDSFNLTVPQGSNRLIQVLAVYSNPVTQALDFLYGDANQTLSSPNQTVSVGLNGLGAGPVTVGQVYGRYFNTSTGGPTGNVSINFVPPGKPKMLIQKSLIANGWFSFFMLNGAVLEYALDNGTLLWGTPVDLTSSLLASSTKVFRADVPVSYFLDSGLVAPTWTLMNPLTYVYGWFTDPQMSPTQASSTLSANSVCFNYSDLSSPVPWLSPYSATPPGPTPVLMTGISSGSAQTPLQLLNLTAPLTQYYLSGGISSTSPCLPSTDQVTTFTFNALKLSGHGSDGAGPFAFPFVDTGSTFGSVSAFTITPNMPSDNTYSLKAKLLSGAETAFDQFVAYKIDGDIGGSGNLSCGQLAAGFLGFAEVGSSTISTGTILFQIPLKDLEVSNGVTVAVCGLKNGTMYDQPYVITSDKFSLSNDLIGSVGAPDHIVARPAPGALSYQACVPFQYELHDAVDNLASNTVSQGIEFTMTSSTPGQVQFFADSGCSTTPVTSMNFYSGQVSAEFYVLSSVPVGNQTSIQLTTTNPLIPVSHRSLTQNLYSSPTTQGIFLLMGGMGVHSYDSCFPVSLRAFESDYSTTDSTLTGSNASATISLSGVTGALYYPSATACSADTMDTAGSGTPSFSFNSHGVAMAYVKIPSAGNSPSAYVTAT